MTITFIFQIAGGISTLLGLFLAIIELQEKFKGVSLHIKSLHKKLYFDPINKESVSDPNSYFNVIIKNRTNHTVKIKSVDFFAKEKGYTFSDPLGLREVIIQPHDSYKHNFIYKDEAEKVGFNRLVGFVTDSLENVYYSCGIISRLLKSGRFK